MGGFWLGSFCSGCVEGGRVLGGEGFYGLFLNKESFGALDFWFLFFFSFAFDILAFLVRQRLTLLGTKV